MRQFFHSAVLVSFYLFLPSLTLASSGTIIYPYDGFPYLYGALGSSAIAASTVQLGDVNGDGKDDLLMSGYIAGGIEFGGAPIERKRSLTNVDVNLTIADDFCTSCATEYLGDINGDGYDDFYVGNSRSADSLTEVGIFYGRALMPETITFPTEAAATISLPDSGAEATLFNIDDIGDVNGDGIDDLSISLVEVTAVGDTYAYEGNVYYFFGNTNTDPLTGAVDLTTASVILTSSSASGNVILDETGSISLDLSGDGINDQLLTTYVFEDDDVTDITYSLFYGPFSTGDTLTVESRDAVFTADATISELQEVGDVNGDGAEDFVSQIGSALYIYLGSSTELWAGDVTLGADNAGAVLPESCNCNFDYDYELMNADLNNDGFSDLLVGKSGRTFPGLHGSRIRESIDVYYGSSELNVSDPNITYIGNSYVHSGDLNGDDRTDLLFLEDSTIYIGYSVDSDHDGYTAVAGDCNNRNKRIFPGHKESSLNFRDDDCDGQRDEGYTYSYKKHGKLTSISYNSDTGLATIQYEHKKRKQYGYSMAISSDSSHGQLWSILGDGKAYVIIDYYFEEICIHDAYTFTEVGCRDLNRADGGYGNYYQHYGAIKALVNPLTGDQLVVVAKKNRNARETILRPFVISDDYVSTAKDSLLIQGTIDDIHTLTFKDDVLSLSVKNELVADIVVTDHNQLELQTKY